MENQDNNPDLQHKEENPNPEKILENKKDGEEIHGEIELNKEEVQKEEKKEEVKKEEEKKERDKKEGDKKEGDKKKEEEKKVDKKNKKKNEKEFFIYFIETHSSNCINHIEIDNNKYVEGIQKVKEDFLDNELKGNYSIQRLKISTDKKYINIKFKVSNTDLNNFTAEINLKDISEIRDDYFFYDFELIPDKKKRNDLMYDENNTIILNHHQQFKLFFIYIDEINEEKEKDSLFKNLMLSTKKLLIIKEAKKEKDKEKTVEYYDFILFMKVITSYYKNPIILELLKDFELGNFNSKYMSFTNITYPEIFSMQKNINEIENNIDNILKDVEKSEEKTKHKSNLFFIILVFKQFLDRNNFQQTLNNILRIEDTQNRIYKGIVKFHELFEGGNFDKFQISKMVSVSDTFKRIKRSISYITNINDYLEIILENFEHIVKVREGDIKKENDKKKKLDDYNLDISRDLIKETDNIAKICDNYEKIMDKQHEKKIEKFIIFAPKLFDKYMKYFNGQNLGNLYILMNLIKKIIKKFEQKEKSNPKNQKAKKDKKDADDDMLSNYKKTEKNLEENIVQTGISLSIKRVLTNMEILEFMTKEKEYIKYQSQVNKGSAQYYAQIFKGLHIENINDEFLKEWKKFDWKKFFGEEDIYVYKNIFDSVNNFKYFGILMKLLNTSQNENEFKFTSELLKKLDDKIINLYSSIERNDEEQYRKYFVELIYQSDSDNSIGSSELLKFAKLKFNFKKVKSILLDLCLYHGKKLSDNSKNTIILYFYESNEDDNYNSLIQFAELFECLRRPTFQLIKKEELKKEDIWLLEENLRIKLFKGLLERADITNPIYKKIEYVKNSLDVIKELKNEFDNNDEKYSNILLFFKADKLKEFENRIKLIYLNDETQASNKLDEIYNKKAAIDKALEDIDLIYDDFNTFLYISQIENMSKIESIKFGINQGPLNYYENNCRQECNKLISKYKQKAEERQKKKQSLFFMALHTENSKNKKLNDIKWIENTEEQFEKLRPIFTETSFKSIDKKITMTCLNQIKEKSNEEIMDEIDKLIKIFGVQDNTIDKNKIVEKIKLLARSEDIRNAAIKISIFIRCTGVKTTEFKNAIEKIIKTLQDNFNEEDIKEGKDVLSKVGMDIDILYEKDKDRKFKNNYLKLLSLLHEDSINFLIKRTSEDCQTLKELVGQDDSQFLTINTIIDLEKCVGFMNSLGKEEELKTINDNDLIKLFVDKTKESNEELVLRFTSYTNNFIEIKKLFESRLDKSAASRQMIESILKSSKFILKSSKSESFFGEYYEKSISKKEGEEAETETISKNGIKIDDLLELRDRAQLAKKLTGDENIKDIMKKSKQFIQFASEINTILIQLKKISISGYPNIIEVTIEFNDYIPSYLCDSDTTYENIIKSLKERLSDLRKQQLDAYEKYPLLRFIYGSQFNLISKMEHEKIYPLLMYITNNSINNQIKDFKFPQKNNNIENIIENCRLYLEEVLKRNNLDLSLIYKNNLIYQEFKYNGLYINYVDKSENLEKDLFLIYKYLTKKSPISQNILLCTKDTTNEELTAFIYRACLCEFNTCFILGGIEFLEYEKKAKILKLLNELDALLDKRDRTDKKMKSCFIILYTNKNSDIYKSLNLLKFKQDLDIPLKNYSKIKIGKEESKVEIFDSDKSGVGKSTQIKLQIEQDNKKYIYFPFGGVISREDIIKRLNDLKPKISDNKNCAIHLDLYDTEQVDLITDFLFSILITKIYGHDEDIFYIPKEIEIKIEIPNGFVNLINKFPILDLFDKTTLLIRELKPLKVTKDLKSNIQIVANYLKLFNDYQIDNTDLFIKDLTPIEYQVFKTIKNAKILSQEECQKIIFEEIKKTISHPNYYQITSFVDVLAKQFKEFNRNYYLTSHLLSEYHIDTSIRTFIIESYIKLTKHFTKGAYNELIEAQERARKIFSLNQFNEQDGIQKGINELSNIKPNLISFDKFNYSIIFFNEGSGIGFRIISNLPGIPGVIPNPEQNNDEIEDDNLAIARAEYRKLFDLYNFQNNRDTKKHLPNYKAYTQLQFLQELKEILNLNNPITIEEHQKNKEYNEQIKVLKKQQNKEVKAEDLKDVSLKSLEEIVGKYVFTADNFIKMILILLRIRANIPVIMMGETGCGKTSLVRMLSKLLNNGDEKKMKVLNIHAGTSDSDIIDFIKKDILEEAEKIKKVDDIIEENLVRGQIYVRKKLWIFLDEINTCKSMGLISELMCKHSYQGTELPKNVVFIAACNPYRCYENGKKNNEGLDITKAFKQKKFLTEKDLEKLKRNATSNLVYTVNPLPHSLLNFVFDFGNLEPKDEEKYIETIVEEPIKRINQEEQGKLSEDQVERIHILATKLISKAQKFTRDNNEISSVSLREIRRFNIFYEFFYYHLKQKKEDARNPKVNSLDIKVDRYYENCDYLTLHRYAIILGVFMCYYLRIVENDTRKKFVEVMNDEMKDLDEFFRYKDFLDIPEREEKYVLDNMELEKGIAQNRALLDNTFSLFVAINKKIPIFIVGKPGCSKSLSVQLINKSMKGDNSRFPLFKKCPQIIFSSYQGSLASTSTGVENVFKQAKKKYENLGEENRKKNVSMIFFDEMGLAEHSPNNPLKVIHAQLDEALDEGKNNIAFVGISNWTLDASKMNRGMHLSIPEPSKEDTEKTALTIGESYDKNIASKYKTFYEGLGQAYFKYKKYLKSSHKEDGKEDFHGNRDFYHLIKYSARELSKKKNQVEKDIAFLGLERNFGGLKFIQSDGGQESTSIKIIKELYSSQRSENNYKVLERIKENIVDTKSRYLLIISKSSASIFLLSAILSEINKNYNLYVGSQFYRDHHSEEYSLKILNKIQLHMEEGKVLILKNLESVYPALYDLFNQNFTIVSKKNYARIAIGSSTNTFSLVDNEFRCIVSVNYEQIDQEEPPFLNRFEKHIVSLDYLLNDHLKFDSIKIFNKLKEMIELDKETYKGINYSLQKLFFNCELEEIQGIIYQASKKGVKRSELIDEVISKISLTLPQDIILCLKLNGFYKKEPDLINKILTGYNKGEHHNLRKFLESMTNPKNIIYTFTNNLEVIKNLENIKNSTFGEISLNNIKEIKISSCKSENELENEIDVFFNEEKLKVCLIKFNTYEGKFINYVQFFIENKEKELLEDKKRNVKVFIFIVNIIRIYDSELKNLEKKSKKEQRIVNRKMLKETISNLSQYYQIFIDNLNGKDNIKLDPIFNSEGLDIFKNFIDFKEELSKNIYETLTYMKLNIQFSFGELNEETYIGKLINYLDRNESIKESFNECVKNEIGLKGNEEDIIINMFTQKDRIRSNDKDIIGIINENLSHKYTDYLAQFYFKAEKDNFFATILSIEEEKKMSSSTNENLTKIQEGIKQSYFQEFKIQSKNKIVKKSGQNLINIYLGLKIPKIVTTLKEIINFIKEEIESKYIKNENNLRKDNEGNKNKNNYENQLNGFNEALYNEIKKKPFLQKMNKENEQNKENEIFSIFLEDYYTFFIFENVKNLREKKNNEKSSKSASINDVKNFLKYIVDLKYKNNEEKDPNKKIAGKINWVECYKRNIATILQMFSSLSIVVKDLNNKIIEVNKGQEQISKTESSSSIVNDVFFFAMESILRVVTSNVDIYKSQKEDSNDFYELMNINQEILQNALKLETSLHLSTKEAYSLEEIIEIINVMSKSGIDTIENIEIIIKFVSDEASLIANIKEENDINGFKAFKHFEKFYKFLEEKIGKNDLFTKLMSIIFHNEYLKIPNKDFRSQLLEIIISRNDFVFNCYPLLKLILKRVGISIRPKSIKENLVILDENNDQLVQILNKKQSDFLDQIIIQIFEHLFLEFFDNIDKISEKSDKKDRECFKDFLEKKDNEEKDYIIYIIFEESLNIFEQCIKKISYLISNVNGERKNVTNLSKLYSIAYIKIYLMKFAEFCGKYNDKDIEIIFDRINTSVNRNENLENIIKIYIMKILYNLNHRNFEKLFNYDFMHRKEFEGLNNSQYYLINYFMPLNENDEKEFKYGLRKYYSIIGHGPEKKEEKKKENEKNYSNEEEKSEAIEEISINSNDNEINNIDIFLSITINNLISNLILKDYLKPNNKELEDYKKIGEFLNRSLNSQNFNQNLKKLLNLFYDKKEFSNVLKKKFEDQLKGKIILGEPYESLLYGLKFCTQSLLKENDEEKKYFYASLISDKVSEIINSSYIPGNNAEKNKKLETLKSLKYCLYNSNADTGYYVCSCGYLYSIGPCGFPTEEHTAKCPDCGKPIGYGKKKIENKGASNHGMVVRAGHYRIFKNLEQKKEQMSRWNDIDENIPNRTLDQYKEEVMESIKSSSKKGIFKDTKSDFLDKSKSIRKMSKISYRLLNFILFNHFFYANCLGFISDDVLKNEFLIEGMNCLEIIQSNWNLLEEALKEINVSSIQAFLNIIFKDLSELISNCKILENESELIDFEEKVEEVVESTIKKYPEYYEKYKKMNMELNLIDQKDIKVILSETYPPLPPIYP